MLFLVAQAPIYNSFRRRLTLVKYHCYNNNNDHHHHYHHHHHHHHHNYYYYYYYYYYIYQLSRQNIVKRGLLTIKIAIYTIFFLCRLRLVFTSDGVEVVSVVVRALVI